MTEEALRLKAVQSELLLRSGYHVPKQALELDGEKQKRVLESIEKALTTARRDAGVVLNLEVQTLAELVFASGATEGILLGAIGQFLHYLPEKSTVTRFEFENNSVVMVTLAGTCESP